MARKGKTTFEWRGEEVKQKVERATGRAMVSWAENVIAGAKRGVHRLSGTLSRSLHAAGRNYSGDNDERAAKVGSLSMGGVGSSMNLPDWDGSKTRAYIEAGSWITYAIYEWARGGSHDFLTAANAAANS